MEIKADETWKAIDSAVTYALSWCWKIMSWFWPVVLLCLVLSGVKDILAIGEWVPNVGPPLYWLYAAGIYYLVKKSP